MTSIVTFRAEDGAALGRILTLSDISQMRRLAMEKERFIRTMVHELKSPLGAVRSIIEVATDKSLGDDLEAYLPMLRRAENRIDDLVQLIGDLLSLSRSEQAQAHGRARAARGGAGGERGPRRSRPSGSRPGASPPARSSSPVCRRCLSRRRPRHDPHQPGGQRRQVQPGRRERRRYGPATTANGSASTSRTRASASPRRTSTWCFTEFFREKRPETRGLEGSGLGLAIVKRLTERAGGRAGAGQRSRARARRSRCCCPGSLLR